MANALQDDDLWAEWFSEEEDKDNEFDAGEWKYVLALDPGGTTGLALFRYTDETLPELVFLYHIDGGLVGYYDFFFESYLDENLVVVSEQWVERVGIKSKDHTPCYIEGVQLAQWGLNRVIYQTPDMKQMVPDEKLKEQHLWVPNARHAMDATIHALVYLRSIKHKPTLEALSGLRFETIGESEDSKDKFGGGKGKGDGEAGFEAALRAALADMDGEPDGEADGQGQGDQPGDGDQEGQGGAWITDDEKPKGPGQHGDYAPTPKGGDHALEKDDGKRGKRRERNGVFVGYHPTEDGEETELFSD